NDVSFSSAVESGTVTVNTTGEVEFDGALTSAVTFGAAGTLVLNEDLTGTIAFADVEGVVILADGKDISSHIEDASNGKGTLTVEGASTFAGNIIDIKQINAGATGKTVEFDGTVDATDIKITGTGTVNFDGTVG